LHTFGERFADPDKDRPLRPLRLAPPGNRSMVGEQIPDSVDQMPESLGYNPATRTLRVGEGTISPVAPEVVGYQVSGVPVLRSWFDYRKRNPAIKHSSLLDDIQPSKWTPDQTTELLKLLDVLTGLVELEPQQEEVLELICSGPLLGTSDLEKAGILPAHAIAGPAVTPPGQEALPLGTVDSAEDDSKRQRVARPAASGRRPSRPVARPHGAKFRPRRTR
jgi:hypothetical protein